MGDIEQAVEAAANALTDAHANAPLPEVADWNVLARIAVEAAAPILQVEVRALLQEVLTTDHVWYDEPDEHATDCPGCALEQRIRTALTDGEVSS